MTPLPISPGLHLTMIVAVMTFAAMVLVGETRADKEARGARTRLMGFLILLIWSVYNAYYFHPSNFRVETSLPLHVCDLLGVISAVALITSNRSARALLYFCALPLAGQALLTPTGDQNPLTARFWLYWLLHASIILASLADLLIRRFHPKPSDLLTALTWDAGYLAVVVPVNILAGWNYGYLGDAKPDVVTGVDLFGPWPGRIALMAAAVACIQTAMYLPWWIWRLTRARRLAGGRAKRAEA